MINLNKIVIAFDGSKGSWKAVEWAAGLAEKVGAGLTAITVVKPPEFSATISEVDEFWEDSEKYFRPQIEKLRLFGERNGIDIKRRSSAGILRKV
jgi:nucleotide-binding universal stress UspA family protein